jgi:hypothetical protein
MGVVKRIPMAAAGASICAFAGVIAPLAGVICA